MLTEQQVKQMVVDDKDDIAACCSELVHACHGLSLYVGGWDKKQNLSEAINKRINRLLEVKKDHEKGKKSGRYLPHRDIVEVGIADCVIEIFDMAGGFNMDLAGTIAERMEDFYKRKFAEKAASS